MTTHADPLTLNDRFGLPGLLSFDEGKGGLTGVVISGDDARGTVYLHGAHVTSYLPAGHDPVLFLASGARFSKGKAIRGGIPICFPWFGPNQADSSAPSHGLARTRSWDVLETDRAEDGGVGIVFGAEFGALVARYCVVFGKALSLIFEVENQGEKPVTFEHVLHSYLSVGDVRQASVDGLAGTTYLDQLADRARCTQKDETLRFAGETDRIYLDTPSQKVVHDPVLGRRIVLEVEGARSTVVWNPWTAKTARMGDLSDDEWPHMLCIETGNVADDAVRLEPGGSHRMKTSIASFRRRSSSSCKA